MDKRKSISPRKKLEVLKRDHYSCRICGRNSASDPNLILEVDHIIPYSKGGSDDISNLQTLCMYCNRGKGNNENLNKTLEEQIINVLRKINPLIMEKLSNEERISVVANSEDFAGLVRLNNCCKFLKIEPSSNTIIGFHAGYNFGIYTINDNHGAKTHFYLSFYER